MCFAFELIISSKLPFLYLLPILGLDYLHYLSPIDSRTVVNTMPTPPKLKEHKSRITALEPKYGAKREESASSTGSKGSKGSKGKGSQERGYNDRRRLYEQGREQLHPGLKGEIIPELIGAHSDYHARGDRVDSAERHYDERKKREESRMGRRSSTSRQRYADDDSDYHGLDSLAHLRLASRAEDAVTREAR
jgi:hypothetical protein